MIRCSRCGKLAPTGAMSCQNCGLPLVNSGAGVAGTGQAEQELPAWLESLRAHERPASSGQENRQPFSLDELVDEDSMPSWMRQDRRKMPENGNSDSFPALPAMPVEAGQEQQVTAANGFQAGSLIDERSLPTWMRENQSQGGEQPGTAQNVSAHSLVDQQGLPTWIKDLSQAAQTPAPASNHYGLPAQTQTMNQYGLPVQTPITPPSLPSAPRVPQTPPTNEPPLALSQGFSAHDLLDVHSMPSWMSGAQGPGQGPGSQPPTRPVPTEQGFSAGELVDQRSVPAWMKDLQGPEKSTPQSAMGVPVSGSGQMTGMEQDIQGVSSGEGMPAGSLLDRNSMPAWMQESQLSSTPQVPQAGQGMAAGSLLDMNSMPAWMREGAQGGPQGTPPAGQNAAAGSLLDASAAPSWMQGNQPNNAPQSAGQGMAAGSLLDMNSMPAWMREGAQGGAQGTQSPGQGMAAGSLIDMNSMPAWLRNADNGQPGAGGRPGQPPARPVPSRPRNEMAPQEQSEVAANVFASMLGVAASAPALPGQEPTPASNNLGVAQGQPMPPLPPFQQVQPSLPGWQQPPMNPYNQGAQPPMWQVPEAMPTMSPPPAPNAYAPAGYPGAPQQRANNAEQPAWAAYPATDRTALGVTAGAGAAHPNPGKATPTDTKKKGFFDSIRDFFTK